jgi:hypothetical protein
MVVVEYRSDLTDHKHSTYEIFESLDEAITFKERMEDEMTRDDGFDVVIGLSVADFNLNRIYKEDSGWNYEDFTDTYESRIQLDY